MSAILSEGVKPTLAELERFEEAPEGMFQYTFFVKYVKQVGFLFLQRLIWKLWPM